MPGRLDLYNGKDLDGAFWFRKKINQDDITGNYTFEMVHSDDTDVVYVNGVKIGSTAYEFASTRKYPVPASLLLKGENTIAIRIIDTGGPGSINGDIKVVSDHTAGISLNGKWEYSVTAEIYNGHIHQNNLSILDLDKRPNIVYFSPYETPSSLYNAMIHPLIS